MQKQSVYHLFDDSKTGRPEKVSDDKTVAVEEPPLIGQISFDELFSELRF